jgi:SAM-dependent methyltransferase
MSSAQSCANCPGSAVRHVFRRGGRRVVACRSCGLQFCTEYPDLQAADAEIYTAAYFQGALAEQPERRRIFSRLLEEIESVLGRRGRLLDVGAGEGALLRAASARGWRAEGVEVSSAMVRHVREALGLEVHQGTLEKLSLPEAAYDAVILNHVLEHVQNPVSTLRRIAALLVPDGVVRIEVPNLASLSSRLKNLQSRLGLKRNPWKHYAVEHHFWFFTPGTLRLTLRSARLEPIRLAAPARQGNAGVAGFGLVRRFYGKTLLGKHIVACARRRPEV